MGIFFDAEFSNYIEKAEYVSNRIIAVTLNINKHRPRVTFIQAYAPQHGRPREEKEQFYEHLQDILDITSNESYVIIMGDLTAMLGGRRLMA